MSLVADYSDSEEEETRNKAYDVNDDWSECNQKVTNSHSGNRPEKDKQLIQLKESNSSNNFLLSGVDSGSSGSESDEGESPKKNLSSRRKQTDLKLDNPFRTLGGATNVSKEESVFRNPFREKEEQKIAVLEHHVKMTDNPETALTINGKKICWNYRKRKCYLGTQCPYAHDSDVPLTEEQLNEQKAEGDLHRTAGGNINANVGGVKNAFNMSNTKTHLPATASVVAGGYDSSAFFSSPHLSGNNAKNTDKQSNNTGDETVEQPYSKSKKRVGLTNSLIPPKKALNLYHKTKDT